ncbi:hypothetical protein EDD86DRAFT_211010 [Gorgonomyces haynaldii]|nr:hypothetical protein EDD86DRAFT_211010 [Gorgonomyces haynaldii]
MEYEFESTHVCQRQRVQKHHFDRQSIIQQSLSRPKKKKDSMTPLMQNMNQMSLGLDRSDTIKDRPMQRHEQDASRIYRNNSQPTERNIALERQNSDRQQRSPLERNHSQPLERSNSDRLQLPRNNSDRQEIYRNDSSYASNHRDDDPFHRSMDRIGADHFDFPMSADIVSEPEQVYTCGDCQADVYDMSEAFEIEALGKVFHFDCFRCCECRDLFSEDLPYVPVEDKAYCDRCYENLFVSTCAACKKPITDGDIRYAYNRPFHARHLRCKICKHTIKGQHIEHKGRIYCPQDYAQLAESMCSGCGDNIDGDIVHAIGQSWHRECLACTSCRMPFPDKKFFVFDNLPFCRLHYHEAAGTLCGKCEYPIEGECVRVADTNINYHPQCWCCDVCQKPFSDTYYALGNNTYCEKDARNLYKTTGQKLSKRSTLTPKKR